MRKVEFKLEKNSDKGNTQIQNKNGGERDK